MNLHLRRSAKMALMVCLGITTMTSSVLAAPETTTVALLPASDKPSRSTPFFTGPRIAATMLGTTGIAAIVVGAVYASRADELTAKSQQYCLVSDPDRCKPQGYEFRRQASQDGRVGTTALGIGTAAVFLSIALAWVNPEFHGPGRNVSSSSAGATTFRIVPVIGASQQGVVLSGVF